MHDPRVIPSRLACSASATGVLPLAFWPTGASITMFKSGLPTRLFAERTITCCPAAFCHALFCAGWRRLLSVKNPAHMSLCDIWTTCAFVSNVQVWAPDQTFCGANNHLLFSGVSPYAFLCKQNYLFLLRKQFTPALPDPFGISLQYNNLRE